MEKSERIKELVELLNKASRAYYQEANEIMTNFEYDKLYDELVGLEKETGIVLSNSPTINVGYEVVSELPKEQHGSAMLSLDKTKEVSALEDFLKDKEGVLSWKLDGLTIVLTYENGVLQKAVTRGNGQVGEVVTANAKTFKNIPLSIAHQGRLVLRGEAIIKYSDFEAINREIQDADSKYKNPRNLCSGSVRQLNSEITSKRNVNFVAFALIEAEGVEDSNLVEGQLSGDSANSQLFGNSIDGQLKWLESMGFETVERKIVTRYTVADAVAYFSEQIQDNDYPSDGLVMMFDDIQYGISLGATAKFPRNGIAFKWEDEQAKTKLQYIEWSPSRTGLINPVAVFDPVELEGTTVSRASVHNVSIMEELQLGTGDEILVYKANMIIPQISDNLTKSGIDPLPTECPVCGQHTEIKADNGVKTLYCVNKECPAKQIKLYTLFVSRNAMNIDGLSEETLEKFISAGYIHEFADIFNLNRYEHEIVTTPGFGEKSYNNLIASVEKARDVELPALIYSLGIPNIGVANAKVICKAFSYDIEAIKSATVEQLVQIDGIGQIMAEKFCQYFADETNNLRLANLLAEVNVKLPDTGNVEQNMNGLVFVITGSVEQFANRDEVKSYIEQRGGKVTGSVSAKTNYLINNDATSSSSKNKKAKSLGIPIITEQEFLDMWK